VDGMRLLATLAFEGFGAAVLPATAAPPGLAARHWRRVPVEGLSPRSVGVAVRRRGLLSAPSRAVRQVLERVVRDEGAHHPGVHPS